MDKLPMIGSDILLDEWNLESTPGLVEGLHKHLRLRSYFNPDRLIETGSKANGLETPVGRGTTRNTSVSFFPARRPSIVSVTPQSEDVLLRGRL